MNFCVHGLYIENCPHCRKSQGIKPPTQLVKLAPREIPIPTPRKDEFTNRSSSLGTPIFEPSKNASLQPKRITRNFDLQKDAFESSPSMFEMKRTEMQQKTNPKEKLHESDIKISLKKIEKQFFEL